MSHKANKETYYKIFVPVVLSFIALAVQWGVVTTKLDLFEFEIRKLVKSNDKMCHELTEVKSELSFIRGKMGE